MWRIFSFKNNYIQVHHGSVFHYFESGPYFLYIYIYRILQRVVSTSSNCWFNFDFYTFPNMTRALLSFQISADTLVSVLTTDTSTVDKSNETGYGRKYPESSLCCNPGDIVRRMWSEPSSDSTSWVASTKAQFPNVYPLPLCPRSIVFSSASY